MWSYTQGAEFALENSLFGAKLIRNADLGKYSHSGYYIGFEAQGSSSLSDGTGFDKDVIIFSTDMSSSVYIDNKLKDTLILGKGQTDALNNTKLSAEKECCITFTA